MCVDVKRKSRASRRRREEIKGAKRAGAVKARDDATLFLPVLDKVPVGWAMWDAPRLLPFAFRFFRHPCGILVGPEGEPHRCHPGALQARGGSGGEERLWAGAGAPREGSPGKYLGVMRLVS